MGLTGLFLPLILLLNILLQLRTLKLPLHPDSGLFLYRAILSRNGERFEYGRRTGNGVFDFTGDYSRFQIKFLVYVFMNTLYRIIPPHPKAFRVFFAFYNTLSALAVYAIGSLAFGAVEGLAGALLFVLLSANPFSDSHQIHAEHYAVLPLLLAVIFLILGIPQSGFFFPFLSGLFMAGTVFLFKITFLIEVPALLALTLFSGVPLCGLFFLCGFAVLIFIVYLGCRHFDTLPSFYSMMNTFTAGGIFRHYKHSMKSELQKESPVKSISPLLLLRLSSWSLPFLSLLCLLFLLRFPPAPVEGLLLVWALLSALGIVIQGKYFQSHLFPLYPPLALLGGLALPILLTERFLHSSSAPQILLLTLAAGLLLLWIGELFRFHVLFSPLQYHIRKCVMRDYQTLSYLATEPIAAYIRKRTPRGSRILQWGYHHELYVLALRRGSLGPHLENSLQTDPVLNDGYFGPIWRSWLLEAVADQRPIYIVDMRGSLNIDCLNRGTGLNYEPEKLFYGLFQVYRLSDQPQRPKKKVEVKDLTFLSDLLKIRGKDLATEDFVTRVNRLFNNGEREAANRETHGGVEALLKDWSALNT